MKETQTIQTNEYPRRIDRHPTPVEELDEMEIGELERVVRIGAAL